MIGQVVRLLKARGVSSLCVYTLDVWIENFQQVEGWIVWLGMTTYEKFPLQAVFCKHVGCDNGLINHYFPLSVSYEGQAAVGRC